MSEATFLLCLSNFKKNIYISECNDSAGMQDVNSKVDLYVYLKKKKTMFVAFVFVGYLVISFVVPRIRMVIVLLKIIYSFTKIFGRNI